jgi:hypothetical protein
MSGSYFTKSFAVEHLLDRALEPALDDHLKRLAALDHAGATEALFDFRVADIAMAQAIFSSRPSIASSAGSRTISIGGLGLHCSSARARRLGAPQ